MSSDPDNTKTAERRVPRSGTHRYAMTLPLVWLLLGVAVQAATQLELLGEKHFQSVFGGQPQTLEVRWRNSANRIVSADIRTRIFQASSATAVLIEERPWKRLEILPGQTVLENMALQFPDVRAETRFVIEWVEGKNKLGISDVMAYPADLLKELKPILRHQPLGVFDPLNQLKPVLDKVSIEISDLEEVGLDHYDGNLAILGPFESRSQMRAGFDGSVKALATRGAGVVWIQPPPEKHRPLQPSFCTLRVGKGTLVVVQAEVVEGVAQRPEPQLALLELCRLAANPRSSRLPDFDLEP